MKLSELVYQCVKNVVYFDDASFTYEQFLQGKHDGNPDYATNIRNVFNPINEAIMRLGDLEKIPYCIDEVVAVDGAFSKSSLQRNCRFIYGVATMKNGVAVPLNFRIIGDRVHVDNVNYGALLVEYKEDIPYFDENSYKYEYIVNSLGGYDLVTSRDISLSEHNITNAMCSAIIEYVKGSLGEQVAPELANMHITRAEQYFANIDTAHSQLRQQFVQSKNKIGE